MSFPRFLAIALLVHCLPACGPRIDGGLDESPVSDPYAAPFYAQYPDLVAWRPLATAFSTAKATNRPVLLLVTAHNCAPCVSLHLALLSEPHRASFINAAFVPTKIVSHLRKASDQNEALISLFKRFNVGGFPTLIVLSPSGHELGRSMWVGREETFAFLKKHARALQ
jgi:uncharacterized protein YyaL (SSP411 family)